MPGRAKVARLPSGGAGQGVLAAQRRPRRRRQRPAGALSFRAGEAALKVLARLRQQWHHHGMARIHDVVFDSRWVLLDPEGNEFCLSRR